MAGKKVAVFIESHPIGSTAWFHPLFDGAVHIPLHDPVVRLIGEVNVSVLVDW